MLRKLLLVSIMVSYQVPALDLFKADYTVSKNGKQIGKSSIELNKNEPFYTITDKTTGTHGMASLLGFKRSETTIFLEENGELIPKSYQMKQKIAFNKRHSEYQVNSDNHKVVGKHRGDDWQLDTTDKFLTPNLVSLNLFNDICAGKRSDLNYKVLKKGKIQSYKFIITSQKDNIIEVDKIHSKPTRITKMWLDINEHCLPIRTITPKKMKRTWKPSLCN